MSLESPEQVQATNIPVPDVDAAIRTRRGFLGALLTGVASVLLVALHWLVSRRAPSAGRDPNLTPPTLLPTRVPTPAPAAGTPAGD
jgi:hypothetical protein